MRLKTQKKEQKCRIIRHFLQIAKNNPYKNENKIEKYKYINFQNAQFADTIEV